MEHNLLNVDNDAWGSLDRLETVSISTVDLLTVERAELTVSKSLGSTGIVSLTSDVYVPSFSVSASQGHDQDERGDTWHLDLARFPVRTNPNLPWVDQGVPTSLDFFET
ncbi:hypothetical protein NMY22_g11763 [Coprinellus aureogranulatus]|nr:hypothetical protein NMY22_g11763 [Coprinellus aureogranulatus]